MSVSTKSRPSSRSTRAKASTKPATKPDTKPALPSGPRFLVIVGTPYGYGRAEPPESPAVLPQDATLVDNIVAGDYGTAEEAIAECCRINEIVLMIDRDHDSWAMVVVDPEGRSGGTIR